MSEIDKKLEVLQQLAFVAGYRYAAVDANEEVPESVLDAAWGVYGITQKQADESSIDLPALLEEWEEMRAEVGRSKTYARNLAETMWRQHYLNDAPDWEPLDDLAGLLTQIDNMVSDMMRRQALKDQDNG